MMTSAQIRQSYLDFFREKQHTIVPSSSLMPDSPNLLFTNAGMNQFVPIFLGQTQCPYNPGRAADTQKCIRAGGKHNDLDDVGLDTYHHTFFEMLGNWSFGDYFKKEAIEWAWELVVERWGFPANRVYATVYFPKIDTASSDFRWATAVGPAIACAKGEMNLDELPQHSDGFDQEAAVFWARKFLAAGLDPAVHIVPGNKKDNFWMMGETGPCGPCSELHIDLTPLGDTKGALVNTGDARCIEIWNLVFIQFNANPDGTFSPLPAQHVDTGMGFERVTSIIQGTKGFTDFANAKISNYDTDIFRPIFDEIEKLSGKTYRSTLPGEKSTPADQNRPPANAMSGTAGIPSPAASATSPKAKAPSESADAQSPADDPNRPVADEGSRPASAPSRAANPASPVAELPDPKPVPTSQTANPASHDPIAIDIAFRVIADHIRTLSFAIADGIQPGNNDRNYVLRRILRRAVRYGRTLGFKEPFFYKLVGVLACEMGDVFPEIRTKQKLVEETLKREEEAFNKTLDKGLALFESEVSRVLGSARDSRADFGDSPKSSPHAAKGALYSRRNLPHYERPWGKYAVSFSTNQRHTLSEAERDITLQCVLYPFHHGKYHLYAACVMPDHVHLLFEPQVKENDAQGALVFYSLTDLLHSIKSVSAHQINQSRGATGPVWDKESFDRLIRSDADLQEKYLYITRNPWDASVVGENEDYRWVWTEESAAAQVGEGALGGSPSAARESRALPGDPVAVQMLPGAFAFKLYDEQGFPLDLTELMARERGLKVDVEGFERLMGEQRSRARAAQKKTVIELSEIETKTATHFLGYDHAHTGADVQEVLSVKGKTVVIANNSVCYAEMGGQVGDTGEMTSGGNVWRIANTQKSGNTWLHFLEDADAPAVGDHITLELDWKRRTAIQRHHSVTHLLHWALHEIVSQEATQKGSFVGPDKLTFDFNSAALTPQQVRDIERLVNEKIVENAPISWTEVPYADVKGRADIMQFFGDKYGDTVRVVDIGGYSKELCAGTHARATGEIGLFRIVSESAVAAGVRRIEAVAGLQAYETAMSESERLKALAAKLNSPAAEIEMKLESLLARQKELERALKTAQQREAAGRAGDLLSQAETIHGTPAILANLGAADGDTLQTVADALKAHGFVGVIVLGGVANEAVSLVAATSPEFVVRHPAGKIIQTIAPIIGGKGGGRPDGARGGGKDPAKLDEALVAVRQMLAVA